MVSRPRLRQPPGRPAALAGGGLPPHRGHHRQGARVHQGRQGGRAGQAVLPLLRARRVPRAAPRAARSGSTGTGASSTWATRRSASRPCARQKEMGIVPPDTELPPLNPIGTPRPGPAPTASRSRAGLHPAVGLARRRREAPVRADGGGLRRLPGARRPPDRAAARLPGGDRAARQHARRRGLRQRRQRRGRPERLRQRDEVLQRRPRRHGREPRQARRARRPETYNHYPTGWAMAFNTPFKMWKRYEFNGGTCDPCIISWPAGIEGAGRDPRPVPPRDRHRADDPRRASASSRPRRSRATRRAASTGSACATASTTRRRRSNRQTQFYAMLGSRGDLARGLEGRHHAPAHRRLGPLQRRQLGALPHRRRPGRAARPRRRAPGQAQGAGQRSGSPRPAPTGRSRSTTGPRWRS